MFYVCIVRFNVMKNLKYFVNFFRTSQGLAKPNPGCPALPPPLPV